MMAHSGADIVDLDWMVDFGRPRDDGRQIAVCGNFDPLAVMLRGTPDEVREATRACLRLGGTRISAAGCEIPDGTPHANLLAQAEALRGKLMTRPRRSRKIREVFVDREAIRPYTHTSHISDRPHSAIGRRRLEKALARGLGLFGWRCRHSANTNQHNSPAFDCRAQFSADTQFHAGAEAISRSDCADALALDSARPVCAQHSHTNPSVASHFDQRRPKDRSLGFSICLGLGN